MFTTRIRPKISVKPLAITKYRPASVNPESVTRIQSGTPPFSPKPEPNALYPTQASANTSASRPATGPARSPIRVRSVITER